MSLRNSSTREGRNPGAAAAGSGRTTKAGRLARLGARCILALLGVAVVPDLSPSGVPQRQVQALVDLYSASQARLQAIFLNPTGRTQSSQEFRQARAAQLVSQVDQVLAGLGQQRQLWIGHAAPQAYRDGLIRGEQQAAAVGVRPPASDVKGSFGLIDKETVEVFAHDIAADLARAERSLGDNTKSALRKTAQLAIPENKLDAILAGGVIEGTPRDATRQLRDALKAVVGGTIDIPTKSGGVMHFDVRKYAELVAVTKTRQATVVGRHTKLRRLGLDLVSIIGATSGNFCTAFLGQVFSIGGGHSKYPPLDSLPGGGPPFHPRCSKSTRPYIDSLASDDQRDDARGLDDARKLLGMTATQAQRAYKNLQLQQQVMAGYGAS